LYTIFRTNIIPAINTTNNITTKAPNRNVKIGAGVSSGCVDDESVKSVCGSETDKVDDGSVVVDDVVVDDVVDNTDEGKF
jgi:hypothetical protein